MLSTLVESLTSTHFTTGLLAGVIGAMVAAAIGLPWRSRNRRPAPVHAALATIALIFALWRVKELPVAFLASSVLLFAAGVLHPYVMRSQVAQVLIAVPGAWLLASAAPPTTESWLRWFTMAAALIGGPIVASFDRSDRESGFGPLLWLVTAIGVFAGVPDTEEALVLLGVAAPLALLGWPAGIIRLGSVAYALVGAFLWVVVSGGRGRPPSVIAVTACLGILIILPLVAGGLVSPSMRRPNWAAFARTVIIHTGIVFVASRIASVQPSAMRAALVAASALVGGGFVLRVMARAATTNELPAPRREPP